MRPVQQGRIWVDMPVVLVFCLTVICLLLFFIALRRPICDWSVAPRAQFSALSAAAELFANEFDDYPPSGANDPTGQPYCGSMKLTEALMGQDLFGCHVKSIFRRDGLDAAGALLYPPNIDNLPVALRETALKDRKGPFLQAENANAHRLVDIYGKGNTGSLPEDAFVLCDCYPRARPSGEKTGMPILYYRANPSGTVHDLANPDNPQNIFNYKDNQALLVLGVPGKLGETHPLADPKRFYLNTQDREMPSKPYRRDSFILISAGEDGLYGTADDVCNFEWKYRKR